MTTKKTVAAKERTITEVVEKPLSIRDQIVTVTVHFTNPLEENLSAVQIKAVAEEIAKQMTNIEGATISEVFITSIDIEF